MADTEQDFLRLAEALRKLYPGKRLLLDEPEDADCSGWISNIGANEFDVVIRSPGNAERYGLYIHSEMDFCGPDEVFKDQEALLARIAELESQP